ncbi:MAG: hypothetical protein KJ930_04325 [Gammaproteobacteria bacterium]|jgi:hypothetical protein|nr:hypothetical protein [Gammaproteobacteria bacterium]MBU2178641.1 hypothetical protein [Gammaproteobacteria bacterium]MBU2280667.1 hypothetical protein [Gammaproteobacteria bacterium]MBU2426492.1 hypothetical protein [Gammaproteobacteria bacterium]
MVLTIIIVLVIALVVFAVITNAMQQHKERLATLKRAEFSKLRSMLEDTEEILLNAANVPLTPGISQMLLKRIAYTLKAMVELEPGSRDLKSRLSDTEKRLSEMGANPGIPSENISLPDNDKQIIGMIQGIKKLRTILRAEHARGNIDTQLVVQEDRRLENLQLRINVESQIKRGNQARSGQMLGSARQCYEKALITLSNASHADEYVIAKRNEMNSILAEIAEELKEGNLRDRQKKAEAENNDLDVLFAPKRKW